MRRHRERFTHAFAVVVLLASSAGSAQFARADEPSADVRTTARALFDEGRALMDAKSFALACAKFAESQRLDPGGGTMLNLARCHELEGKTATAWLEYKEALRVARDEAREERITFAEEHLAGLEPRLARLALLVPPEARAAGLVIKRNGISLGEGAWDQAVPVDPGEQVVEASAPGKLSRTVSVRVAEGERQAFAMVPLEDAPVVPSPSAAPQRDGKTERIVGLALGGAGVVALGFGAYFGVRAIGRQNDAERGCVAQDRCSPDAETTNNQAKLLADLSTGFVVAGAVLAGAGVVLYLTAPKKGSSPATTGQVAPFVAPGLAGAGYSRAF